MSTMTPRSSSSTLAGDPSPNNPKMNDVEGQKLSSTSSQKVPHWRLVASQTLITDAVLHYPYKGSGTEEDPYVVEYIPNDPRNPLEFGQVKKWTITIIVAVATLAISFVSSAYASAVPQLVEEFSCSSEIATLGVSLFVLGFAVGPVMWGPLSELYGRQIIFFGTYAAVTIFNAGTAGIQSIGSLVVLRFFGGTFGASPLTNAGGVVADLFPPSQRGLGMSIFACAPFLGPVLGPIIGGFVSETIGWRWLMGIMTIFTGFFWIFASLTVPETYTPVILGKRAALLSKKTGKVYISSFEKRQGKITPRAAFSKALLRPWVLLFLEPIVLLISIYMAILYGTLYMLFGAFPIVFTEVRGWSQGVGGLAFLGVMMGMMIGLAYATYDNKRYARLDKEYNGDAPPEARLPPSLIAAVAVPVGMFWFAWTNYPNIHWIVCIIGTAPFGFGMVVIFLSCMNYLIDSYTIYAASVLAANSILRSLFGAGFPLFTRYMYQNLGIHWASSIPAFLALACMPFPFIFYKYGRTIRMRCKYAAAAHEVMEQMKQDNQKNKEDQEEIEEQRKEKQREAQQQQQSERRSNQEEKKNDDLA